VSSNGIKRVHKLAGKQLPARILGGLGPLQDGVAVDDCASNGSAWGSEGPAWEVGAHIRIQELMAEEREEVHEVLEVGHGESFGNVAILVLSAAEDDQTTFLRNARSRNPLQIEAVLQTPVLVALLVDPMAVDNLDRVG
jgi:hypothetical protein